MRTIFLGAGLAMIAFSRNSPLWIALGFGLVIVAAISPWEQQS